jgi:hypothetical protein
MQAGCDRVAAMRAQRIKTVFHRVGLVLGTIFWLPAALLGAWMVSDWPTTAPNSSGTPVLRMVALGVAMYAICAGVGRLLASQFGDDAKNPN